MNIINIELFNFINNLSLQNRIDEIEYLLLKNQYNNISILDNDIRLLFKLGIINIRTSFDDNKIIVFNRNRKIVNYQQKMASFAELSTKILQKKIYVFVQGNKLLAFDE